MSVPTPGEVLQEEFLLPLGLSSTKLARRMGVPVNRVTAIIRGERRVRARTAIRLGEALGTSAEFWMNLQTGVDLWKAGYRRQVPVAREERV